MKVRKFCPLSLEKFDHLKRPDPEVIVWASTDIIFQVWVMEEIETGQLLSRDF